MHAHISRVIWVMLGFGLIALCHGSSASADALSAAVPSDATRVADEELATLRGGGLLSFIPGLIGALPPGNTVVIQIGNQPPVTNSGSTPQSLTLSLGGTTASASASKTTAFASIRQWR